jgi:RNA-directed DNA polymerase
VRSLQRRIVQAVQAGRWRKVKRLSYLLVRSLAGRALSFKRVTENAGKKTPGVGGKVIASRKPDDIPAFNQQILKKMT